MTQYALAKFIDDGHLARHLRRGQAIYASRRDALLCGLADKLAPWFQPVPAGTGLHLAALARRPLDIDLLTRLARRAGVGLRPLAEFYAGTPPRDGLFFGAFRGLRNLPGIGTPPGVERALQSFHIYH